MVWTSGRSMHFQPRALLVLVSVLAAAVYFTVQKSWTQRHGAEAVTAVTILGGALGAAPFGLDLPHALELLGGAVVISGVILANSRPRLRLERTSQPGLDC